MVPSLLTTRTTRSHRPNDSDHCLPAGRLRWRAATWLLALAVLLGAAGCGGDEDIDRTDEPADEADVVEGTTHDPMEGLQLTLGLDRLEFEAGEAFTLSLELANWSDEPRTLSFRTTQRFDLLLLDEAGEEIRRWSEDQAFGQALGEEVLEPESDGPQWTAEWTAPDTPGSYRLEAVILPAEGELRMGVPIEVG